MKSAGLGSGDAAAELAFAYMEGYGTEQSNENWLNGRELRINEQCTRCSLAWNSLSRWTWRDFHGEKPSCLEIASSRGSSSANIVLGVSYADGQMGLESNLAKAEKYWLIERLRNNDEAVVDQYLIFCII